jgi:hypothetical protein
MTVAKEISKHKLVLAGVQVRWGSDVPIQQSNMHFSKEREMRIMNYAQVLFVHKRIISAVTWVQFVTMSYVAVRSAKRLLV